LSCKVSARGVEKPHAAACDPANLHRDRPECRSERMANSAMRRTPTPTSSLRERVEGRPACGDRQGDGPQERIWIAILLAGLFLLTGCGDDSSPVDVGDPLIDRLLPVCAETLDVHRWCLLEDSLDVRMVGIGGVSSCYHLESMDVSLDDRAYSLQPIVRHLQRVGDECLTMTVEFETTLVFQLPDTGEWWFKAPACEGDSLVAATRVLLEDVIPASLDFLGVPGWCRMDDGIDVRLVGNAGPFEHFEMDRVEIEESEPRYTLRPFVRLIYEEIAARKMDAVPFDTTVVLHPPATGPWWITVEAANGTFVDSTKVK
jgi:hypothetical protein